MSLVMSTPDEVKAEMLEKFMNLTEEEYGYAKDEFDDIDTDG